MNGGESGSGNNPDRSRQAARRSGNLPTMPTTNYWGLRDIAEYLGVRYSSARTYHGRAEINRRRGTVRPGDMPPPDTRYGNSPVWEIEHIVMWKNSIRPGKGTGGGRPRGSIVLLRVTCPVCQQVVGVTKEWTLYRHRMPDGDEYCKGSRSTVDPTDVPLDTAEAG